MYLLYAIKIFLGTWLAAGIVTALGGLAWTCNISSRLLKDTQKPSSTT